METCDLGYWDRTVRGCQGCGCCSGKLLKEKTVELSSVEHSFWWRKGLLEDLHGKISAVPEFQEALVIGVDWGGAFWWVVREGSRD